MCKCLWLTNCMFAAKHCVVFLWETVYRKRVHVCVVWCEVWRRVTFSNYITFFLPVRLVQSAHWDAHKHIFIPWHFAAFCSPHTPQHRESHIAHNKGYQVLQITFYTAKMQYNTKCKLLTVLSLPDYVNWLKQILNKADISDFPLLGGGHRPVAGSSTVCIARLNMSQQANKVCHHLQGSFKMHQRNPPAVPFTSLSIPQSIVHLLFTWKSRNVMSPCHAYQIFVLRWSLITGKYIVWTRAKSHSRLWLMVWLAVVYRRAL